MATVYRAEDIKHGRTVALKVLRPELTSAMGTDRPERRSNRGTLVRWTDGSTVADLPPNAGALGWSRDSRRLLYAIFASVGNVPDLGILDIATGDITRVTTTPESETHAAFTADGNAVILRRVKIVERVMRADVSGVLRAAAP